jgi:molecular chaperone IbpA
MLAVTGRKAENRGREGNYLHIGIATRAFERHFELADFVRVEAADMKDGLLSIELVREIPDAMKPRKIEIRGGDTRSIEGSASTQPRHEPEVERETA